uniref:Glycosyl transferase family 25 domain-containing protein n=1 Tax=viral metagenome TaxID=1070528 RepID=A0A6C0I291_9ZZZZ
MSKKFNFNKSNTFCISLEDAHVRWESMERRFSEFNLDVTRWIASTAPTDNFVSNLSIVQKACCQSHINIYKHILENNLEYAFVLEDDACFDKNWEQKLEEFDHPNWDLILLNGSEEMANKNVWECTINNLQYLCGGYIISKKGAEWILSSYYNNYYMSDWMTSRFQTLGTSYCYFPWLIIQEGTNTQIGSNFNADHAKVIRLLGEIDYSLDNYSI